MTDLTSALVTIFNIYAKNVNVSGKVVSSDYVAMNMIPYVVPSTKFTLNKKNKLTATPIPGGEKLVIDLAEEELEFSVTGLSVCTFTSLLTFFQRFSTSKSDPSYPHYMKIEIGATENGADVHLLDYTPNTDGTPPYSLGVYLSPELTPVYLYGYLENLSASWDGGPSLISMDMKFLVTTLDSSTNV